MSAVPREVLSSDEMIDLDRHEQVIQKGLVGFIEVGSALLAIREQRLYRGAFVTFDDYCRTRWGMSKTHANRLVAASEIATQMTPIGVIPTSESQIRPLAEVEPVDRPKVWQEAVEATGGKPTAKAVQQAADKALGKSKVNGVESADPPDVAKLRASGKIPANAVVDVVEPEHVSSVEAVAEEYAEQAAKEEDLSDADWVQSLPLYASLAPRMARKFYADALNFRRLMPALDAFKNQARRIVPKGTAGLVAFKVRSFLMLRHPREWVMCAAADAGGCGGTGSTMLGECPACHGRGYHA